MTIQEQHQAVLDAANADADTNAEIKRHMWRDRSRDHPRAVTTTPPWRGSAYVWQPEHPHWKRGIATKRQKEAA